MLVNSLYDPKENIHNIGNACRNALSLASANALGSARLSARCGKYIKSEKLKSWSDIAPSKQEVSV